MTEEEMDYTDAQLLRKRAEELLEKNKKDLTLSEIKIDYKTLLYELKIQQTALELQNEALRKAYGTAEAALKKYTLLFDLAAMGYFLLEPDGTINELNFTGADMLLERRFTLKGTNFKLFVAEDSKKKFNDFFEKTYSTNAKESCKIMLGYDDNPLCQVYMEGIVTEDEQNCLLSVVNLSRL
jgi:hypothetical protein